MTFCLWLTGCSTSVLQSPSPLYIFDVQHLHLNHHALCNGPCIPETTPPDEKTHDQLLQEYDQLIFLSSLQGIVNKNKPRLYLVHHPTDQFWLDIYQTPDQLYGWLSETDIIILPDFETVLDTFATDIDGLVSWHADVPATLNVATTIAGVEGWPIVRESSDLATQLTQRWPIQQTLGGQFTSNLAAYQWAIDHYLRTGKANYTLLGYIEDGWPATRYEQGLMTRGGVYALERDYLIQQRGFAFDLSPWQDEAPEEAAMLADIMDAARQEAGLELIKMWGFIPWYEKYASEPGF
ncbi:MAG: GxGYxYP domain-containing protein, partial [Chloroflexota bacterium]